MRYNIQPIHSSNSRQWIQKKMNERVECYAHSRATKFIVFIMNY